jgi:hypothetical protein
MELIRSLEKLVAGWLKNVPHLPPAGQKWLAENVWWIALIGAILSGIAALFSISAIMIAVSPAALLWAVPGFVAFAVISAIIGLVFNIVRAVLLGMSVTPLRELQKKGWVLLFLNWIVYALYIVVSAILSLLTLSFFGFFAGVIFGAIGLAISGYFLFEIHGQFAHEAKIVRTRKKKA